MRIWTSQHIFDHDWETVVTAAWHKYPNPMNGAMSGIDVLSQKVEEGRIESERVLQSQFSIPGWASRLTGFRGTQYSHEFSSIDPSTRRMHLLTRNLNGCSFLRVDERLTYAPHPTDPNKTVLEQEAVVQVNLPAFTDKCEGAFLNLYQSQATKGRSGIEWVIEQLRREVDQFSHKVADTVHDVSDAFRRPTAKKNQ